MEETETAGAAPEPSPVEPESSEVATPSSQRWIVLGAVLAFVAVVAGSVVILKTGEDEELPPLSLSQGAATELAGVADMAMPAQEITYELAGELPGLGSEAPVYRLVAPEMDGDRVQEMAATVGVEGLLEASAGGWTVTGEEGSFGVAPVPGGWSVSSYEVLGTVGSSAVPGSPELSSSEGSSSAPGAPMASVASSSVTTMAGGAAGQVDDAGVRVEEPMPPTGPEDLPSEEEAESLAHDLLVRLGVLEGEWDVATSPSGMMGFAVACAEGEECPETDVQETILSWSVTFARVVDGVPASGLEWAVDVGDRGAIQSLWGTLSDLEHMGDYPLRSTTEVFEDLKAGEDMFGGPVPLGAGAPAVGAPVDPAVGVGQSEPASVGSDSGTAEPPVTNTMPCPGNARCPDGVMVEVVPPTDLPEGPGDQIAEGEPPPGSGAGPSPTTVPQPMPEPVPEPMPEPEPMVVTITGAERGSMLYPGIEGGVEVAYLVPTYRYTGSYADGSEFLSYDLIALDESYIQVPDTTVPATVTTVPDSTDTAPPFTTVAPDPDSSTSIPTTWVPTSPQVPLTTTSLP